MSVHHGRRVFGLVHSDPARQFEIADYHLFFIIYVHLLYLRRMKIKAVAFSNYNDYHLNAIMSC